MAKRHRRTKAEMAIARAEKAEKIAKKFQAKIDKKLDEHPQVKDELDKQNIKYEVVTEVC